MLGGRVLSPPTHEALRDPDVHRSMPSMDWYRAARAKYRGEISWETMIAAEDRVRELDAELNRAMEGQRHDVKRSNV